MSRGVEWRFQNTPDTSSQPTPVASMTATPSGSISSRPTTSRLRRISGIFEQTASDVREGANQVLNTVIIPATDTSQKYAAEQPVKATFLALLTVLSFVPVLLFILFVIGVVVFAVFTSVSFAITSTTLAFTLGVALLASIMLVCVAPASILFTVTAFLALSVVHFVQFLAQNSQKWYYQLRSWQT